MPAVPRRVPAGARSDGRCRGNPQRDAAPRGLRRGDPLTGIHRCSSHAQTDVRSTSPTADDLTRHSPGNRAIAEETGRSRVEGAALPGRQQHRPLRVPWLRAGGGPLGEHRGEPEQRQRDVHSCRHRGHAWHAPSPWTRRASCAARSGNPSACSPPRYNRRASRNAKRYISYAKKVFGAIVENHAFPLKTVTIPNMIQSLARDLL